MIFVVSKIQSSDRIQMCTSVNLCVLQHLRCLFQRNLTETQKDAITKDFNSLNLTMYVGEMVSFHRLFCISFSSFSGCKRGDYQNCSVLYCVQKLCAVISTLK